MWRNLNQQGEYPAIPPLTYKRIVAKEILFSLATIDIFVAITLFLLNVVNELYISLATMIVSGANGIAMDRI